MSDHDRIEELVRGLGTPNERNYRPLAGVRNRVPQDVYGRVRITVAIGFGFREHADEFATARAYNGQDAFAVANTLGCSDTIVMEIWAKPDGYPEEKYPHPLVCHADEGQCLIRCTFDFAPRRSVAAKDIHSTNIFDFVELRQID